MVLKIFGFGDAEIKIGFLTSASTEMYLKFTRVAMVRKSICISIVILTTNTSIKSFHN